MAESKKHKLTTFGLTMIVIGACIGSGIFLTPQGVAAKIQDPLFILLAWFIGGFIALTGALTYSELAGLFPKAGGIYVFLKESFGKRIAFLYGWSVLSVITSGSIAAVVIVCVDYFNALIGNVLTSSDCIYISLSVIVFNSIIHIRGLKLGEVFINFLSVLKIVGVLILVGVGLYFLSNNIELISAPVVGRTTDNVWLLMGASMIPILWSFGGFQHASFLSAEAKNPGKSVPKAMIGGVLIVSVLYLLCNLAYLSALGTEGLMASEKPALDSLNAVIPGSGVFILVLIVISTFGSAFIFTMSAPRIYYAMAKDDVFFNWIAKRHKKYNTPANAIAIQSFWSCVLILLWGTFEELINYVTFIEWIFLLMAGASVFYFRTKYKKSDYLFRLPFYPVLPALFCLAVVGFLSVVLSNKNEPALYGVVLIVIGLVVYELFIYAQRNKNRS